MFVVNFKLNVKKILIVCVLIALLAAAIIESGSIKTSSVNTKNSDNYDYVMNDENFTKVLKDIHENIDMNLGKTIKISGFIFKMPDFKDSYFVCGRNTIVNNEDTVAGFLCQSTELNKFKENEWIELSGVIIKGEYNGNMPIIKVGNIKKINTPSNTFIKNINE
ncbi:MAG: hypothetical protein RSB67_01480 [Clostridia bacterium]